MICVRKYKLERISLKLKKTEEFQLEAAKQWILFVFVGEDTTPETEVVAKGILCLVWSVLFHSVVDHCPKSLNITGFAERNQDGSPATFFTIW